MGALGGVNEISLRKLLAFSSIRHFGWLCISMRGRARLWIAYFLRYCLMVLTLILLLEERQWVHTHQISREGVLDFILVGGALLSLGGLPPLLGFYPKWGVLRENVAEGAILTSLVAVTSSVITLFYYIRVGVNVMLLSSGGQFKLTRLSSGSVIVLVFNFLGL